MEAGYKVCKDAANITHELENKMSGVGTRVGTEFGAGVGLGQAGFERKGFEPGIGKDLVPRTETGLVFGARVEIDVEPGPHLGLCRQELFALALAWSL